MFPSHDHRRKYYDTTDSVPEGFEVVGLAEIIGEATFEHTQGVPMIQSAMYAKDDDELFDMERNNASVF